MGDGTAFNDGFRSEQCARFLLFQKNFLQIERAIEAPSISRVGQAEKLPTFVLFISFFKKREFLIKWPAERAEIRILMSVALLLNWSGGFVKIFQRIHLNLKLSPLAT